MKILFYASFKAAIFTVAAKQKVFKSAPCLKWKQTEPHIKGVGNIFSSQAETWITPDKLYIAISCFFGCIYLCLKTNPHQLQLFWQTLQVDNN